MSLQTASCGRVRRERPNAGKRRGPSLMTQLSAAEGAGSRSRRPARMRRNDAQSALGRRPSGEFRLRPRGSEDRRHQRPRHRRRGDDYPVGKRFFQEFTLRQLLRVGAELSVGSLLTSGRPSSRQARQYLGPPPLIPAAVAGLIQACRNDQLQNCSQAGNNHIRRFPRPFSGCIRRLDLFFRCWPSHVCLACPCFCI